VPTPVSSPRPPHVERLLARLGELTGPVVQVWGWPGSGKRALLEALLACDEPSRALALAEVESPESLEALLEEPEIAAARWWVALSLPAASLPAACRLLRPGQRLVCAGPRRFDDAELPVSFLGPSELLLREDEGRILCQRILGSATPSREGSRIAAALWQVTSGWYAPMLFAAHALARGELPALADPTADLTADLTASLLEAPAIEAFLRHEVLAPLPDGVRARLHARASGETPTATGVDLEDSIRHGWESQDAGGGSIPELLAAHLRSQPTTSGSSPAVRPRPQVRVALLGPPKVGIVPADPDGTEVEIHWPLTRALKILSYLASSEGLRAAREDLTAALWPEDDEDRIARNFHPTLSHLRRTFHRSWEDTREDPAPPPLLFIHGSYQLNPEITWGVDVVELDELAERGREAREVDSTAAAAAWRTAAALYRGPFLAGVYDAWTEIPRERYLRRWLDLLRELGDLQVELERPTDAIDAYRRILIEDPLREPVHQALMNVYAKQGRRDLIRRQYDRLTTLLAEELGVEPLPQTTEEYHRLMG